MIQRRGRLQHPQICEFTMTFPFRRQQFIYLFIYLFIYFILFYFILFYFTHPTAQAPIRMYIQKTLKHSTDTNSGQIGK